MFWDRLLDFIDAGRVVPVISKDLLTLGEADGGGQLYPYLAERLASYLGVSPENLTIGGELNEVACRYLSAGSQNHVQHIYAALNRIVIKSETLPLPQPLLQLAAIRPFQLFVTSTFDSCMARALDQVRFEGNPRTKVLTYSPEKKKEESDLPADAKAEARPIVYHLLGQVSVMPSYAITQWDMVEYFHALQSETRGPKQLFDELQSQSMLILGNNFGGWLARFFLRMAKGHLGSAVQTADYIADPQLTDDESLVLYIQHFSRGTEIYRSAGPVAFVNELYQRWMERHPDAHAQPSGRIWTATAPPVTGEVFLSYASEDRPVVERIKSALEAAGIEVFFDSEDLQGGEKWEAKVRRKIHECSIFVPVISRHTLTSRRRFFRVEWNLAIEEAQMGQFSDEESFLLPVAIDGIGPDASDVPAKFKTVQWEALPGGQPTSNFVGRVQRLYRKYQKSLMAGTS